MATDEEAVELLIDGYQFVGFEDVELTFGLDTYSTLSFVAPFEAKNESFRKLFRPFSFLPLEVLHGLDSLFVGTMLTPRPEIDESGKRVQITGYAKPAVLSDCSPPGDSMPVQFENANLRTISDALTAPFGLETEFQGDPGAPFRKAKVDTEETVQTFLSNLARQRGFVMTNTPAGKLRYWKSVAPGSPVVRFEQGVPPLTRVIPEFNEQEYFSEITGYAKATKKNPGGKHTVKNPFLTTPLRPRSFKFDDTERGDGAEEATIAKMGRMFGNIVAWKIEGLPTWFDPNGKRWEPNTTLTLKAPDAMIYSEFELVIRNVALRESARVKTADLEVVLPGSFSGEIPEALPWD